MFSRKMVWALASTTGAVLLSLLVPEISFWPPRIGRSPAQPDVQSNPTRLFASPKGGSPASPGSPTGNETLAPIDNSQPAKGREDHKSPLHRWQYGTHWGNESDSTLAAFSGWAERYLAAGEPARAAMVAQGVNLAQQRRATLLDLIVTDPREALASSVPFAVRRRLPEIIAAQLEQRVSGMGDFLVLATVPHEGDSASNPAILRSALIGKERFTAHVFGARRDQRTTMDISLHGVALDGQLALSESPIRLLEPGESPSPDLKSAELICSVSGLASGFVIEATASNGATLATSGDQVYWVCRGGHIEALEYRVKEAESLASQADMAAVVPWTTGSKRILVILVDFSDVVGGPVSPATARDAIDNVTAFIRSNAFNQISFITRDVTPLLRMPRPASYYVNNNDPYTLMEDARNAAAAAGFASTNYEFDVITFARIGLTMNGVSFAGLGFVHGKGCWVQGSLSRGVVAHELGHNLGNWHANSWVSSSIIGTDGTHTEYGNPFDALGYAHNQAHPRNHFSANFKFLYGWLPDAHLHTVTASGTYRIYAHDFGGNLEPTRHYGIRIPVGITAGGETMDYWIDFRPGYGSEATANGAALKWGNDSGSQSASRLLDTQPGTLGNMQDSPLIVGRTFTDADRALSITTLARGGSGTDAYLDIQITFNATPPVTLVEALDRPNAVWTTGGDRPWIGQTAVTHDGADAATSGANSQQSWMETSVTGPGILSFWWKVSSRAYYDYLSVLSDGVLVDEISGELGWQQRDIAVPSGTHTFRWQYGKFESISAGSDRGWVDRISFTPPNDRFDDRIELSGASAITNGSNVDATSEMGEPLHAGINGSKSVWWSWTAPATGLFTVTATGSSFYKLLGVYTGSHVARLSLVAGNHDNIGVNSSVSFLAIAGTTYQIAVDGYYGGTGAVTLSIAPTPRLRMAPVQRLADGTCRIWIANADGTPIESTQFSRISVLASSSTAGDWTRLTGTRGASSGMLWIDDPDARNLPMRFYRASERP